MNRARTSLRARACFHAGAVLIIAGLGTGGCSAVPVYEQGLVSRPGMTFSDSLVEAPRVNLLSQVESGTAVSGGAQAAGCTACR